MTMANIDSSGQPFDFKGESYVALAPAIRNMGGDIQWDNTTKTAQATLGQRTLSIQMANDSVTVDGQQVQLSAPPLVVDDTLIVPADFFAQALGS